MSKKSMAERRQARGSAGGGNGRGSARSPQYRRQKSSSRRPWGLFAAIGAVVAVFVVVIVVADLSAQPTTQDTQVLPAPAQVVSAVTHIPTANLNKVGKGDINFPPAAVPSPTTLTSQGKPEVLYVGAEYCPYCALERWSLIGALSEFGSFHNLKIIRGSATDPAGTNIATFTFAHGVTYSSPYLTFVARELYSNVPDKSSTNGYTPFQRLTAQEATLFTQVGQSGFPFVDFGGKIAQVGSESTSPGPPGLEGYDWQQIASLLAKTSSTPAKMILGGVNYDTAAICSITGNRPGSVCDRPLVRQLEAGL